MNVTKVVLLMNAHSAVKRERLAFLINVLEWIVDFVVIDVHWSSFVELVS